MLAVEIEYVVKMSSPTLMTIYSVMQNSQIKDVSAKLAQLEAAYEQRMTKLEAAFQQEMAKLEIKISELDRMFASKPCTTTGAIPAA